MAKGLYFKRHHFEARQFDKVFRYSFGTRNVGNVITENLIAPGFH